MTVDYFLFFFAYYGIVFGLPAVRMCDFAVRCKRCGEVIPAPVESMPDTWIVAECALCGERRRYLPNDIFRGRLSDRLMRRPGRNGMLR